MATTTIKSLHSRIRSGQIRPGDDRRFAKALGIGPGDIRLRLCAEALSGSFHAALDLWRTCLPGRPIRIQVDHTPSALRMCAHLLTEIRPA
jgi:hypothetical protein